MRKDNTEELQTKEEAGPEIKITPKKIAIVSKQFNNSESNKNKGFSSFSGHMETVSKISEKEGCDTILYCLYTFDKKKNHKINKGLVFGKTKKIKNVIIEYWDSLDKKFPCRVEVWNKEKTAPYIHFQQFGISQDSKSKKKEFLANFDNRSHGPTLIMICGESNIISTKRKKPPEYIDDFNFLDRLNNNNIKIILNPIHDFMRRYEMKKKREIFSRRGRYIISVWNHGKKRESSEPWTVFFNGTEITDQVKELTPAPIPTRSDIRIGVLSIK